MWVVISRDQCSFCDTAKELLKGYNKSYTEYNVQSPSSKWLLYLLKRSSITTVPQIFNSNGTHIGGYAELKEYLEHEKNQPTFQ
jgi:glutaredoxin